MRKIGNWILKGLTIEISIKPTEGVFTMRIWVGYGWYTYVSE